MLHAGVGIQHDLAGGVGDQPDRQRHRELAAAGLGELPATQPGPDEVQLRFGHRAFQAEQQPVVEAGRVIEPVLVADQGVGEGADLQQPMPVGVVAGQPGDLEPQHDPGAAHADLGDEMLEAFAVSRRGTRLSLVAVDGHDLLDRPTQRDGPLPQRVLTGARFGVVEHLTQRRLAHVEVGDAGQMPGGDLGDGGLDDAHRRSPRPQTRQRHGGEHTDDPVGVDRRHGWGTRWSRRSGRLPRSGPRRDAVALQHRQPQSPACGVAAQGAVTQLLVTLDIGAVADALIGPLRPRRETIGPAPAPPNEGAPGSRTARRSRRPDRPTAATGPPRAAGGRRPRPRR